jgi:hypothetical protein
MPRLSVIVTQRDRQRLNAIAHAERTTAGALAAIAIRELVDAYFAPRARGPRINGEAERGGERVHEPCQSALL